jgi:hypothetical protein
MARARQFLPNHAFFSLSLSVNARAIHSMAAVVQSLIDTLSSMITRARANARGR